MCLRTGSGWHSTYQRRRNPCPRGKHWTTSLRRGRLDFSSLPTPSASGREEKLQMWKLQKFNYFYWKCQKPWKLILGEKNWRPCEICAVCLSFFPLSLSSLVPQVANFHFSFPRSKRTDCPLETSKGCFDSVTSVELLRHPQTASALISAQPETSRERVLHHQLIVSTIRPDTCIKIEPISD